MANNGPLTISPYAAGAMSHHTHGIATTNSMPKPEDEVCPCCNGAISYLRTMQAQMAGANYGNYAPSTAVPSFECNFCSGKGHFKPTDVQYQPVKLYKLALEKAFEIEKENKLQEEARKQRIKESIMSKLTDEEQEFLNANR